MGWNKIGAKSAAFSFNILGLESTLLLLHMYKHRVTENRVRF